MIPVKALANQLSTLLAADASTLAPPALANKVGLVVANFTPTPATVYGDLVISAAASLTPIAVPVGAQAESVDPVTGEYVVEIIPPLGGYRWETPPGFTGPVTVYGFALFDNGAANLWGSVKIDTPILLNGPNQVVTAPPLTFRIDGTKIT